MKKILAIGNSFSEDATRYIHQIAESAGEECLVVNLYIGGCPLWYHADNIVTNKQEYRYERNGEITTRLVSISEAMAEEDWDVITIQQASGLSGKIESFTPFADELLAYIRKNKPAAKIYFHQTWAYEIDSDHPQFHFYNNDQKEMFRRIKDSSEMASKLIDAPIIPVGTVIQKLRETSPEFDYQNGGRSLCLDGFHLNFDYGRFTAAAVWFNILAKGEINLKAFENLDHQLLKNIVATILDTT